MTIREQADRDYHQLERTGFVVRGDLRPEARHAWRCAITGAAHREGVRLDTGEARGQAWAAVNLADGPPDMRR